MCTRSRSSSFAAKSNGGVCLRKLGVAALAAGLAGVAPAAAQVTVGSSPAGHSQGDLGASRAAAGFKAVPDLNRIVELTAKGRKKEAHDVATAVIKKTKKAAADRSARFRSATALFLRSFVAPSEADALADLDAATQLGEPEAPYHLGAHLLIAARSDPNRGHTLMSRAQDAFLLAAQLGDTRSMELLETIYKQTGQRLDQTYWGFVRRMAEADDQGKTTFVDAFDTVFTLKDREEVAAALTAKSLAGGASPPSNGIPGRSLVTCLFVETVMRRQLAFVWMAFFDPKAKAGSLSQSFAHHRKSLNARPFGDVFLLASQPVKEAGVLSVTQPDLAAAILPGDTIVVMAGGRAHYATVWALDRSKGALSVLDPFPEFWQPTHNSTIKQMALTDYLPGRRLVALNWSEVAPTIVAAIVIRDSMAVAPGTPKDSTVVSDKPN